MSGSRTKWLRRFYMDMKKKGAANLSWKKLKRAWTMATPSARKDVKKLACVYSRILVQEGRPSLT